jgi:hypothetical protein
MMAANGWIVPSQNICHSSRTDCHIRKDMHAMTQVRVPVRRGHTTLRGQLETMHIVLKAVQPAIPGMPTVRL